MLTFFPQTLVAVADMSYAEARLGPERIRGAYAWKSLQRFSDSDLPLQFIHEISVFLKR